MKLIISRGIPCCQWQIPLSLVLRFIHLATMLGMAAHKDVAPRNDDRLFSCGDTLSDPVYNIFFHRNAYASLVRLEDYDRQLTTHAGFLQYQIF